MLYEGFFGTVVPDHGHGVVIGDAAGIAAGEVNGRLSFHHDLFSLLVDRAPQLTVNCPDPAQQPVCASDAVNNYVYGWRKHGTLVANNHGHSYANVSGNFFRAGLDTPSVSVALGMSDWGRNPSALVPDAALGVQLSDNRVHVSAGVSEPAQVLCKRWNQSVGRWDLCDPQSYASQPWGPAITTTDPVQARDQVLADAGASRRLDGSGVWRAARDSTDKRIISDATNGTGHIITDFADVPGWPSLSKGTPPLDRPGRHARCLGGPPVPRRHTRRRHPRRRRRRLHEPRGVPQRHAGVLSGAAGAARRRGSRCAEPHEMP